MANDQPRDKSFNRFYGSFAPYIIPEELTDSRNMAEDRK